MVGRVEITEIRDERVLVCELVGELDLAATPGMRRRLLRAIESLSTPPVVVLDLRGLTILSAAGVRVLVETAMTLRTNGARVSLMLGEDSPLWPVATAPGLADAINVVRSVTAALDPETRVDAVPVRDEQHAARPSEAAPAGETPTSTDSGNMFALLTEDLLAADTVGEVLSRVVRTVADLMPEADLASITLRDVDGRLHTPTRSDPVAEKLDGVQYRWEQGPCYDVALPTGPDITACGDLSGPNPWPRFAVAATSAGLSAVLATALIPGPTPDRVVGALNVYSRTAHGLDRLDRDVLLLLATHASLALAHTSAVTHAALETTQLRHALDTRDVIGQAKGIIMARRGVDADEAFDILRRASQDLNVKLVELARTLADRHNELDRR